MKKNFKAGLIITQMKKQNKTKLLVLLILGFLLTSCSFDLSKEYSSLDKNNNFKEIDLTTLNKMLKEKQSFYLVMGFPKCPWCQSLMPVLDDVSKSNNQLVYYLDIFQMRENEKDKDFKLFHEVVDEYFYLSKSENGKINAPTFYKISEGKVILYHINTVPSHVKNDIGVLPELTIEQEKELKNILNNYFNS